MTDYSPADQARHLMAIVRELRELGIDPPLVQLSEDGVTEVGMTLTDELSLIAINIDYDAAMEAQPSRAVRQRLGVLHFPRLYRYRVSQPGLRASWNRYPGCVIGAAVVVGKHAYCVKWGAAS